MSDEASRYRDPSTGQFGYWNDFDRMCKCGHTLGVHIAGGFECGIDAVGGGEPEAVGCKCQKFRPSGKRHPSPETGGTK